MRKSLALFFLACSLLLVLGHSLIPHSHDEEIRWSFQISEKKGLSLADLAKIALSFDLGANHLEEYKTCNAQNDAQARALPDFTHSAEAVFIPINYIITRYFCGVKVILLTALHTGTPQFRAPPVLS